MVRIGKSRMNLLISAPSNVSSNCPFGLFLSEQICVAMGLIRHCDRGQGQIGCTFASIVFGAIPALIVRPVVASTSARNCETTSAAVMLFSVIYGVMLEH
jgi:hypothetical protein